MNRAKKAALVLAAAGVAVGRLRRYAQSRHDEGSSAHGVAKGSPGVISGNVIQIPLDVPINACGNTIDILIGS
ncbi:hypothetical protein GCM10020221_17280 [Streptomyces thioluteus]|uniref:Chaplin domain-containing protein n=1 Tax=Streptomyces thioluteus TaxID=66431 RepID=A0ABN3WMQ5_STRTU